MAPAAAFFLSHDGGTCSMLAACSAVNSCADSLLLLLASAFAGAV
ncbi:hypothetical protein [Streptomyces sp. NPDC056105]